MKKKVALLMTIALLVSQFLPVSNIFAEDDTDKDPSMEVVVSDGLNGSGSNARIGLGGTLTFTATIKDASIPSEGRNVSWSYNVGGGVQTTQTVIGADEKTTFTLDYSAISGANPGTNYVMTATYDDNGTVITGQVRFGVLGGENPAIIIITPGDGAELSKFDPTHLKILTFKGSESVTLNVKWVCEGGIDIAGGYACPANNSDESDIAYRKVGTYKISVQVIDNDNKVGTDEITLKVIEDEPKIQLVSTDKNPQEYNTNDVAKVKITAKDKFGTVNNVEWGCKSVDANVAIDTEDIVFDSSYTFNPSAKKVNYSVGISLPDTKTDNYLCKIRATDDDGLKSNAVSVMFKVTPPPEPGDNNDMITSPNTGAMTKKNDFADGDAIIIVASAFVILGAFALTKEIKKHLTL